ncbi:MAG: hypothetical protein AAB069_04250, partial [Planctomycetota bacterium]
SDLMDPFSLTILNPFFSRSLTSSLNFISSFYFHITAELSGNRVYPRKSAANSSFQLTPKLHSGIRMAEKLQSC